MDLSFRLVGETVPIDHGYALYGAVCAALPELHRADWLGIHPIDGEPIGDGRLSLRRSSAVTFRVPAERIPELLLLAGRSLIVAGRAMRLGAPVVLPLLPASSLDARCVHVRLTRAPRFENAELGRRTIDMAEMKKATERELERQLSAQGVQGARIELCGRRTIAVGGQRLVGFSVRVSELESESSVTLQALGLGGKRAMGCGIFRATKGARNDES